MSSSCPMQAVEFSAAEIDLWTEEFLTVCGEGRALIVGPRADAFVGRLLGRGIDAWGVDTQPRVVRPTADERCVSGTLGDLPGEHSPFRSVFILGGLEDLDEAWLAERLTVLRSSLRGSLHVRLFHRATDARDRSWWERLFLANGYRKHPLRSLVQPYASLEQEEPLVLYFEVAGLNSDGPMQARDPSRCLGRTADAILARYELGARLVRPWDTVLDLACGCGAGTNILQRMTRGERYIGIDGDSAAIAYAQASFSAANMEFRHLDPADALMQLPEASVDLAICAVPLAETEAVDGLLRGMERIVAPGGRLIMVVAHLAHEMTGDFVRDRLRPGYIFEAAYRQHGDDVFSTRRAMESVAAGELLTDFADAWILVLMRDPLAERTVPYRETAFRHVAQLPKHSVLNFADYYRNPWILHSLMHPGMRLNAGAELARSAMRIIQRYPADSADCGAALCLLIYRAFEGALPEGMSAEEVNQRSEQYLELKNPDPLQYRWQISIAFALGQLAMRRGQFAAARKRFATVADMDVFRWGPALATKPAEAMFLAGWLAWCAEDLADCRHWWQRGVEYGRQLLRHPLDETLLNPEFPNLFDYGDGMRELIYTLETTARCTNGLHGLKLREQGISFRWDLIFNTFRAQRDLRECHLRAAQQCVVSLCRDIDGVRTELRERTRELDELRAENDQTRKESWAKLTTFAQ